MQGLEVAAGAVMREAVEAVDMEEAVGVVVMTEAVAVVVMAEVEGAGAAASLTL